MTRRLPSVLKRLIPGLGSPSDQKILDAACAIEYILSTENLDWYDLADMVMRSEVSRRKPAPTPEVRERREREFSKWTIKFIEDFLPGAPTWGPQ
ncbi:MAG TPA: hypothetical protein VIF02_12800 [Methylocella sp.]|jgi:hypothetical protein